MAKPHSLVDHIYYENRKDYTHVEGDIAYLDAAPLRRPFEMPRAQRIIALVIIIAAVVLGLLFLNNTRNGPGRTGACGKPHAPALYRNRSTNEPCNPAKRR